MRGELDLGLVALSVAVAIFAAYTAFALLQRFRGELGQPRWRWLCASAIAMGGGIWTMHFIGMLAYQVPVPVSYSAGLTLVSLLVPIVVTGIGLVVVSSYSVSSIARPYHESPRMAPILGRIAGDQRHWALGIGGVVMGIGIVAMHYLGMAAMQMPVSIRYDRAIVAASIAIAIGASTIGLFLAHRVAVPWQALAAALALGIAVSGMHYTAMLAVRLMPLEASPTPLQTVGILPETLAVAVGGTAAGLLALALALATYHGKLADSARREAEALRRSEDRYRALVRNMSDIITLLDGEGRIIYESFTANRILGYPREQIVGRKLVEFVAEHSLPDAQRFLDEMLTESHRSFRSELTLRHADRDWREFEITGTNLLDDASVGGLVVTLRDVSERKRIQQHLNHQYKLATLGKLAAVLAHEMSQPLSAMRIAAIDCLMRIEEGRADLKFQTEVLKIVSEQVARLGAVIDHVRGFSRREEHPLEEFDLRASLGAVIKLLERHYAVEGIALTADLPRHPVVAIGHPRQFEQVILNLVANAHDAIQERQSKPGLIQLRLRRENARVITEVEDNGGGVPPELVDRIFDPFFTTKPIGKGSGLGLAISYDLIQRMHGGLALSRGEAGACFTIWLPSAALAPKGAIG